MSQPELPNFVTILAGKFGSNPAVQVLSRWETLVFSSIIIIALSITALLASRKTAAIPGRFQCAVEMIVGGIDDFVCDLLGPRGRKFTPFIGTLFIYILCMNLVGIVPFLRASTSSWSTTLALAICVFFYLQFTAFKELGFLGYIDHATGKMRGALALSIVVPLLMFFLHMTSELIRPLSLSLRLRSNIWGDDMLLAVLAGIGIKAVPLMIFNMSLAIIIGVVQAGVFCLLTTIYFALLFSEEAVQK